MIHLYGYPKLETVCGIPYDQNPKMVSSEIPLDQQEEICVVCETITYKGLIKMIQDEIDKDVIREIFAFNENE